MALTPVRETVGAVRDVFIKVFELFTGGFSISPDGFNKGVVLPQGSLLKVDEATRLAVPIKTAVSGADSASATAHYLVDGHHFQSGDKLGYGGTAHTITSITAGTGAFEGMDVVLTGGDLEEAATGDIFYESSATGDGDGAIKDVPNGILRYDTTIATGEFATVAIRGTVYKNRIQAHIAGHLANLSHIHFSESK